jgi:hypothetical protein
LSKAGSSYHIDIKHKAGSHKHEVQQASKHYTSKCREGLDSGLAARSDYLQGSCLQDNDLNCHPADGLGTPIDTKQALLSGIRHDVTIRPARKPATPFCTDDSWVRC